MATNTAQWQPQLPPSQSTIDLTNDDEGGSSGSAIDVDSDSDDGQRAAKRQKTSSGSSSITSTAAASLLPTSSTGGAYRAPQVLNQPPTNANFTRPLNPPLNQPAGQWIPPGYTAGQGNSRFAYPAGTANGSGSVSATPVYPPRPAGPQSLTPQALPPSYAAGTTRNTAIDLTNSNTPSPPVGAATAATNGTGDQKRKDNRKDVICIGELTVTALVLYPIDYLLSSPSAMGRDEFVPVRLIYDAAGKKRSRMNEETIRITAPLYKSATGEQMGGEDFGVVEQRVANVLGPLMAKVLIRVSATIRRAGPNSPILTLRILVFTPKGNVPAVAQFLQNASLFLDHPAVPYEPSQHRDNPEYQNPHNPPPGGFRSVMNPTGAGPGGRWSQAAVAGKTLEVQRSQVDEVFNSLRSGDELDETEAGPNVATNLYPHQKKALTFLLEREKELECKASLLWQPRRDAKEKIRAWYNVVTSKETRQKPEDCKGAILADDMGLGKTITVVSLMARTLASAHSFVGAPTITEVIEPKPVVQVVKADRPLTAAHFAGTVWGMPDVLDGEEEQPKSIQSAPTPTVSMSAKQKAKMKTAEQRSAEQQARQARIKTRSRATLVVCPLSTVVNWEDQFKEHWAGEVVVVGGATGVPIAPAAPSGLNPAGSAWGGGSTARGFPTTTQTKDGKRQLKVYVYHGTSRRPDPNYLADFDAVITTYSTLASEYSKQTKSMGTSTPKTEQPRFDEEPDDDDDDDDDGSSDGVAEVDMYGREIVKEKKKSAKRKRPGPSATSSGMATPVNEVSSPLQMVHWFRVVLDEAHSIKETSTIGSRACCDLVADRRLCLTGTPVQNKLDDVYALIKFLRFDPFDDKAVWTEYIGGPAKFGQPLGVARLQTIMKTITLRRTKETKALDGKTILDLPPRRDELRFLKFDENEKRIYDSFFDESKAEFTQMSKNNEVMKNYVGILQKILRLRQICDHWELVQGKGPGDGSVFNEDSALSYDEIIAAITKEGLNTSRATAVFALLRESGTAQCVDCGMDLATPIGAQALDGCDDLEAAKPAKRGRKPKKDLLSRGPTRANSPTGQLRPVLTRCQHLFCIECFRHSTCPDWPNVHANIRRPCSACQYQLEPLADAVEVSPDGLMGGAASKPARKREKRVKTGVDGGFTPSTKVKALLGDLLPFSRSNPYSGNYDPNSIEVTMCDAQGNDMDDGPVKTVVFSQWTSMLDKIEDALEAAGIRYDRLDGTMKRDDRTRAMEALKSDPRCEVLLVSLRAGGVGLNLTAARRVYLMDPYWNPAVENQAVDRIHRLGQKNPVTTVKFVMEDSIETRLLEVQKRKTQLANMTLGQSISKAEMLQRRMEELNQLFSEGPVNAGQQQQQAQAQEEGASAESSSGMNGS